MTGSDTETVYTLDELRGIVLPIVSARSFPRAWVFGSYSRGEADGRSDIDILVDKGDNRLLSVCGAAQEVMDRTGKGVDMFDLSELLPGAFRDTVLAEAVAL